MGEGRAAFGRGGLLLVGGRGAAFGGGGVLLLVGGGGEGGAAFATNLKNAKWGMGIRGGRLLL